MREIAMFSRPIEPSGAHQRTILSMVAHGGDAPCALYTPMVRSSVIALICLLALCASVAPAQPVDYARDVLPILSDNCYHCHGPDENARKAKLRLDTKEGAFRVKDGVAVIVPHDAAKSELVRRITSTDPDEVMPPHDDIRKLQPNQIATLKR